MSTIVPQMLFIAKAKQFFFFFFGHSTQLVGS